MERAHARNLTLRAATSARFTFVITPRAPYRCGGMTLDPRHSLRRGAHGLMLVLALVCAPHPAIAESLTDLLHRLPADSLVAPLERFEKQAARPVDGAEAAMTLGRLHYARPACQLPY